MRFCPAGTTTLAKTANILVAVEATAGLADSRLDTMV